MKCVSVWQPWATLMAIGAKVNETRSWSTRHRGPLLIQASKHWNSELERLCFTPPFLMALRHNESDAEHAMIDRLKASLGKIVCIVDVSASVMITAANVPSRPEFHFGDYTPGRFMWQTCGVYAFPEPVAVKGHQGLFEVDDALILPHLPKWRIRE